MVRGASFQSYCLKFALAAVLLVVIAAVRVPFITNILAGEEGDFAALLLNDPPTSALDYDHLPRQIAGSVDGRLTLSSFHRTVMPYIILERLGRLFASGYALGRLPPEKITIVARLPFAIVFLLGSAGLIALTIHAATSASKYRSAAVAAAPLGVTFWSLTCPLAVGASIEPQIDGSAGVRLCRSWRASAASPLPYASAAPHMWPRRLQPLRLAHPTPTMRADEHHPFE